MSDEFETADEEAQVLEAEVISALPAVIGDNGEATGLASSRTPRDILELRERLIKKYYKGATGLLERLRNEGKDSLDNIIVSLVDEVIAETDSLKGNEQVALHHGNLRDATIISFKRAEVLQKAIQAVQTKQEFERERGLDLDSPQIKIVFQYFMDKCQKVLRKMGYEKDANDIFFRNLYEEMKDWQKELHTEIENFEDA